MDNEQSKTILETIYDTMKPFWVGVAAMGIAADEAAEQVNEFIKSLAALDISRE